MKRRWLLFALMFFFAADIIMAQNQDKLNPFAKYGLNVKVGTITDGMYEEGHDFEDIVEIGSVLFDVRNRKIIGEVPPDTFPQLPAQITSLWLQVDPLAARHYHISPYAFCANNPIKNVDPDGRDWYSYTGENGTTQYQHTTEYRSQKDLDEANKKGTYLGITHKTEDTYYSLLGEQFDLKNEDGTSNLKTEVIQKLDQSIINFYTKDENISADMDISEPYNKNTNGEIRTSYASGDVYYFNANRDDKRGIFSWGSGKYGYVDYSKILPKGVYAPVNDAVARWNNILWRFNDFDSHKKVKSRVEDLLFNR